MWSQRSGQAVRRFMAEHVPHDEWVRRQADHLGALFVGWDLWSCWFLRPSGEVVVVVVGEGEERPETVTVSTDRSHVLSALSRAARRHPELSDLLPSREEDAKDCRCVESPQVFGPGKVICPACGGLGWLPSRGLASP